MNKITALKATLVKLNDPNNEYEHGDESTCNCGFVAQAVGFKVYEITDDPELHHGYYSDCVSRKNMRVCSTSGLPVSVVLRAMFEAGFSAEDISNLEGLVDQEICDRAGITGNVFTNWIETGLREGCGKRENVIAYITAWIEILEEKEPKEVQPEKVYITVKIDSKVKDLANEELILN